MGNIRATDVHCPACNAPPGKFCKRRRSRGRSHRVRRDLAKHMQKEQSCYDRSNVREMVHYPIGDMKGD
jgi:hypothetical protein